MPSIDQVLESLGIATAGVEHRHGKSGWVQIDCCFCGQGSGKFHLGIHLASGRANCWRCGPHGLYEVLLSLTGDRRVAGEILQDLALKRTARTSRILTPCTPPKGVGPLLPPHVRYLKRRSFDPDDLVKLWSLGGIGVAAKLSWRIYAPIAHHGKTVTWTTRAVSASASRRYISASPEDEAMPIKEVLYGVDYCRSAVIVHEGPADVWRTGPGSVAIFGLSYTAAQVAAIAAFPRRVVCLDNQPQAQKTAQRLAADLSVYPGDTFVVCLDAKDAGEATEEEIAELRKFLE